jgi:hypothetical protein
VIEQQPPSEPPVFDASAAALRDQAEGPDALAALPYPELERRVIRATLVVGALGALGGCVIGTVLLAALQVRAPGGFHWAIDLPFGLMFGGTFGAAVGAVGAPLLAWFAFPHVPLGRAMLATGLGTVAGALAGLTLAGAPVLGGCLGFLAAGVALRFLGLRGPRINTASDLHRAGRVDS